LSDGGFYPHHKKATPIWDRFLKEAREGGNTTRRRNLGAAPASQNSLEKSILLERNFHWNFGLFVSR